MRLNRFLAKAGIDSRRGADLLIQAGRVEVNGKKVEELGFVVDENKDEVKVDNKKVEIGQELIYILLNKPKGYLCTVKDPFGRPTVLDLISLDKKRIFPVGRLDLNSQGVLLLTNDGDLAYALTHPKFQVEKVYQVEVQGTVKPEDLEKLEGGMILEEGVKVFAQAEIIKISDNITQLKVTLKEGKKREIKRIFESLGFRVADLVREKFDFLTLKGLEAGQWRHLDQKEVERLKKRGNK